MENEQKQALRAVQGVISHTETFGTVDGPGIRFVLFLQGCPLRCLYCHNPEMVPREGGGVWTAGQAAEEVHRYRHFIRSGGVTFSGGEPLIQPGFVEAACRLLHEEGVHTAIDTSGSEDPEDPVVKAAIDAADLLLLDIKAYDPGLAVRLTGRDNKNAFATLEYCESAGQPVWVRHVLLRGYTLDDAELAALAKKLAGYRCVERVELLPFHQLGEPKWEKLGRPYLLHDVEPTTKEETQAAKGIFRAEGLQVQ